ncbi:unnamed protein product [Rangifer tarandus platyrhynchus]|uniref:Uncharacterized protein n=2 Tax=Rangifer tarandus platyrhynchus TaxID=3082113 RepID=A0ABN8YG76_RANTA|nr:unnamed protein product [Rangifer tarandus platyrhynchus]
MLLPHLCQPLTILCSGLQICCLSVFLTGSILFCPSKGVLLSQLSCGLHRLSANLKDGGSMSTMLKTDVALLTCLGEHGSAVLHNSHEQLWELVFKLWIYFTI